MKKKLLCAALCMGLLLGLLPTAAFAAPGDSASDPILISTAAQLAALATSTDDYTGKYVKLTADIDLSTMCGAGKGDWTPIGSKTDSRNGFCGTFDGDGHTVRNLYIHEGAYDQGLFWQIGEAGTVKNLTVTGRLDSGSPLGGIVGINYGRVENCDNECTIETTGTSGGIVGRNEGVVENCRNAGTVAGEQAGGIAGSHWTGTIRDCDNTGAISCKYVDKEYPWDNIYVYIGGIAGSVVATEAVVECCSNAGPVEANAGTTVAGLNLFIGGVTGENQGTIQDCYNTASVTVSKFSDTGGVVGNSMSGSTTKNCYGFGSISATSGYVGGVIGRDWGSTITSSYFDKSKGTNWTGRTDGIGIPTADFANQSTFVGWDFGTVWAMDPDQGRPVFQRQLTPSHTHSYTYSAAGGVLTERCDCGHTATATLTVTGGPFPYTGSAITPATVDYGDGWAGGSLSVTYSGNTAVGTATARITLGGATAQTTFSIVKGQQTAPAANEGYTVNYAKETLTVAPGYQVSTKNDGTGTAVASGADISSYPGQTLYIRKAETATQGPSDWTALPVPARPGAPVGVAAQPESLKGQKDGKLTGVTTAMEYSADGGQTWKACPGTEVTGLAPGAYQVRVKATDSAFAGAPATLTVAAGHTHVWNGGAVTTPATDAAEGELTYTCTVCNATKTEVIPKSGTAVGVVEVKPDTPAATVGGVQEVAEAAKEDTKSVTVTLTVEAVETPTDKAAIEAVVTQGQTVDFLALTLTKTTVDGNNSTTALITDTGDKVLEIAVDFDFTNKTDVTVYRKHGADAAAALTKADTKADGTFRLVGSGKSGKVYIYASKFSTYAIGYTAAVMPPSSGSGGNSDSDPDTYPPVIRQPEHGKVTVSPAAPEQGERVTVTLTPEAGYEVDSLTVTDRNGKPVEVTRREDGTYTFTQPAGRVTVSAEMRAVSPDCLRDESCPIHPFTDADATAWYHDGVHYCLAHGLMDGYGNGRFGPGDTLTRAMLARILYNMAGQPAVTGDSPFADVAPEAWYAPAVTWAAEEGVVKGYGTGLFGPEDAITREQLATMLWRYAQAQGTDVSVGEDTNILSYTDASRISDYAFPALQWAVGSGVVGGKGGGVLDPTGSATRAEAATMLQRLSQGG